MNKKKNPIARVPYFLFCFFSSFILHPSSLFSADEALLRDGSHLAGALRLEAGRLHFQPAEGGSASLDNFRRIDFPTDSSPVCRLAAGHRLHLPGGQHLSGDILHLGADSLVLRTGWASRLSLPRAGVVLGPLPGRRILFVDPFDDGLGAWAVQGRPAVIALEKALYFHAVVLRDPQEQLSYPLPSPLTAGRVGISFQEQDQPGGAAWSLEAVFQGKGQRRQVSITAAGPEEHYQVRVEELSGAAQAMKRSAGWHRLLLHFSETALRVACDDAVLWYNLEQGPGLPLTRVELRCTAEKGAPIQGGVAWTAFSVERAVDETPRPPASPDQDEVWLDSGDQLFGRILQGDRRRLSVQGRFGTRSFPWSRLQGCSFRGPPSPAPLPSGARVRLHLHSGLSPDADLLDGVLLQLEERRVALQHALLGEITIDRAWLRALEPLR